MKITFVWDGNKLLGWKDCWSGEFFLLGVRVQEQ